MKANYWIINLNISILSRLIKRKKHESIGEVTYIGVSKPASILLKLLNRFKIFAFPFYQIRQRSGPAGPVFNLSSVRNDRGEVISRDIYHHILTVRREILDRVMGTFKDFRFIKEKRTVSGLAAYLGLVIAEEIKTAVYLSHYARWKNHPNNDAQPIKNIMIIPNSIWDDVLVPHLKQNIDEVVLSRKEKKGIRFQLHRVKRFLVCVKTTGLKKSYGLLTSPREVQSSNPAYDYKKSRFMVLYGMGVLKEQRNDIPFLHAAGISPSQLVIYLKFDHLRPSAAEKEWLKKNNVTCFTAPDQPVLAEAAEIPQWQSTGLMEKELTRFYEGFLHTIGECRLNKKEKTNKENTDIYKSWLLDTLWVIGMRIAYWKDFFITNNIGTLVNQIPSSENFIPNLAMSDIGGIVIEFERSIRFDYCTYIHNSFNHTSFITGPYSLTQIPESTFSITTIQSGGINTESGRDSIKGLEQLRQNVSFVLAVFDEIPNDVFFGDAIRQFYEAVTQLVKEDPRFGLLIKTKKPQVLEKFEEIGKDIHRLEAEGRCLIAGWQEKVSTAAACSDIVATMPSTAAFESAVMGKRTIVFNPMRVGSSLFYTNNGLNRRVFEDGPAMIAALKKHADNSTNHNSGDSLGDCTDIAPQIDPFSDNQAARRIGDYVNRCLDSFDAQKEYTDVMTGANQWYSSQFGSDKLTIDNSYERQCL